MISRKQILIGTAGLCIRPSKLLGEADLHYLRDLAGRTIASATKRDSIPTLGFAAVTPGGNYPAIWVRDFSMAAGCGLLTSPQIHDHLRLFARCQADETRKLRSGAVIPSGAIPDHVNYDGTPVFYPGTYSPGEDQGGEPWGIYPPVDDHYELVHLAFVLWTRLRSVDFLGERIRGSTLFDRLWKAMNCPSSDPATGLVVTEAATRAVGFGFCDSIYITGSLLFASLLRFRALREMKELATALGRHQGASDCRTMSGRISRSIAPMFLKDGWLLAATGVGSQPDVWGTAFAVYVRALPSSVSRVCCRTLADATRRGTITFKGAVRHVPTDHDFSATSAWVKTAGEPVNTYQNGAFWNVPTGWLAAALSLTDRALARKVVADMVREFQEDDGNGAPWECIYGDRYRNNPVYMASVTLPLEVLQRP